MENASVLNTKVKLSPWRKIGYALGDGGNNLSYSLVCSFIVFYCTDAYMVSAAAVGTIMLVSRIFDAINDPIIGGLADRTRSRWGSYRPWIIFGGIATAILTVLLFMPMPIASEAGRTAYIAILMILMVTAYTTVNVPYSAMPAVLTQDTDERASISTYRLFVAVAVGIFFIGQVVLPMVMSMGGAAGDLSGGFSKVAIILSAAAIVLYFICFRSTREIVKPAVEKQKFKEMFRAMKGNGPAWMLGFGFLVSGLFVYGRSSTYMYYFTYVAGDMGAFTSFMLIYGVGAIIGTLLVPVIGKRVKSKALLPKWGFLLGGVVMLISYFVDPITNLWLFIILGGGISGLFVCLAQTMMYGMTADCTEYGEYKTGIRAAGFISAFINFMMKIGMAIGTAGIGFLLAATGYIAGEVQTPLVLEAINTFMNLVPAILSFIASIIFFFYKLDRKTYYSMVEEMEAKKSAS